MKDILIILAVIVGCVLLFFIMDYTGLMWESFIGPKRENVRREIFEETKLL